MNKIVLFAPGVFAPWTEGRKIFVADLAATLRNRGVCVELLDGAASPSPGRAILSTLRELRDVCHHPSRLHAVVAFPYGTFYGLRGKVNTLSLLRSRAICSEAEVPHISVFYSCVGLEVDELGNRFAPALAVGRSGVGIGAMHLGIRHRPTRWCPTGEGLKRVLFLCGYQKPTSRALHDVMHERGLADLLDAGSVLAARNIALTIAVPFLRDASMRRRLRLEIARRCPALKVELKTEVDPFALFQCHDAFVFPYRSEHSVFVPTSLLEAMSVGIPVIAADHAMYRSLTVGRDGSRCTLHHVGDASDLALAVCALADDYDAAVGKSVVVASEVRAEWTVERAADEMLAAIKSMTG